MPATGGLERHTGVQQRQRRGADRTHRGGAVGAQRLGDLTDRVGELLAGRQHRHERTLGEGAVADLATLRGTDATGLAGGEGREVVVVHVALGASPGESVSSFCSMSSMFSVETPMIWVSPRWNRAEPWTRGMIATSADSSRMSVGPRPSMRTPSVRVRWRTSFFVSALSAAEISLSAALEALGELLGDVLADGVRWPRRAPACRRSPWPRPARARPARPRRRTRRPGSRGRPGSRRSPCGSLAASSDWASHSALMKGLAASRP